MWENEEKRPFESRPAGLASHAGPLPGASALVRAPVQGQEQVSIRRTPSLIVGKESCLSGSKKKGMHDTYPRPSSASFGGTGSLPPRADRPVRREGKSMLCCCLPRPLPFPAPFPPPSVSRGGPGPADGGEAGGVSLEETQRQSEGEKILAAFSAGQSSRTMAAVM